jgi:hypothetical protein
MRLIPATTFILLCSIPAVAESRTDVPASSIVGAQPQQAIQAPEWNGRDRWGHYLKENFVSPGAFFRAAGPALGQQLGDAPPEWGQGMSGYRKRLADQFAVRTVQGTIEFGTAAATDIDPRYRPCDCSGFFPRLGYALLSNAVTYKTDGNRTFNAPNLVGIYGSSFTALSWYPSRYSYKDAFREGTQSLAFGGSFNIIREFWPEIRKAWPFAGRK